jgi:peptide/nickel transport system substrate-binding protein
MTIEDVKYSIDSLRNHASYKADYAPLTSVTTPDANTIVLKTDAPYAPLLSYLAVGNYGTWKVFPKEIIDSKLTDSNSIGTGPYIRAEHAQGNRIIFKRNPEYWNKDGRPYLDEVRVMIMPDATSRDAAFLTKQIDILPAGANADEVAEFRKRAKDMAYEQVVGRNPSGQGFNTSKAPFNDIRVRRAMMLAYNRDSEAKALYQGKTEVATLMSLRDSKKPSAVPELAENLKYDVAEAKKLMAAAGHPNGFDSTIVWTPAYDTGGNYSATLQRYIGDVKAIGVNLKPISVESGLWIKEVFRPPFNFDGMLWSSSRYYGDPDPYVSYWLHPKGIANHSRVNDPNVTALVEKQRTQLDPKQRLETLHELQRLEGKNAWYMWMSFGHNTTFINKRVHDYVYHQAYEHTEHLNVWVDA